MTEIEQLQLQHKCEQLEKMVGELNLFVRMIIGRVDYNRQAISALLQKDGFTLEIFVDTLNKLPKTFKQIFDYTDCMQTDVFQLSDIFFSYADNITSDYKKTLDALVSTRGEFTIDEDIEYLKSISNYKKEKHE